MRSLRESQEEFARALLGYGSAAARDVVAARGLAPEAGLGVYRNNMLSNYRAALQASYPVVLRLIGPDCFRQAVDGYVRATPSVSGDIGDYGDSFGDFLARNPPTRNLIYLPDVACLEWAIDEAGRAADASSLDLARLAEVASDRLADLRLQLHPSARLLSSPYPVLRIWQANQPQYEGDERIDLAAGGCHLLVMRRADEVEIEALAEAEFALLGALHRGATLGTALQAAISADAAFDPAPCLQRLALSGSLAGFEMAEGPA